MTKKIFAPLAAVAFMALMAVTLVAASGTATAAVNGISPSKTTVDREEVITLTIDADEAAGNVRVIATTGDFESCTGAAACVLVAPVVLEVGPNNDIDFTVDDAGTNVDTLLVTWKAPTTGGVVTFTVIQGSSTKTATVTVRGAVDTVEVSVLRADSSSTTGCVGTVVQVLRSTTASAGFTTGNLCTIVKDATGIRLATSPVIYSTSVGTITPITDTTGATGQVAAASDITAGTTGVAGTTATITASSGGKVGTTTVKFGGDPASCTVTTAPTSVSVGGSATVTVSVLDSTGGPVPDNQTVFVQQANPGSGANAAILDGSPETLNGEAKTAAIAAISGAIAIGASTDTPAASCTGTLIATGSVVPPTTGGTTGTGTLTAPTFGTSNVGSAVFSGGTIAQLSAAVTASGGTAVWVQGTNGNWYRYNTLATGATAFVNNAFNAQFAGGLPQSAVFVVK